MTYGYDDLGRRASLTFRNGERRGAFQRSLNLDVRAAETRCCYAAESIAYRYDARGRLVEVVRNAGSGDVVTTYAYDRADNRTVKTTSGSPNPPPP